MSVDCQSSSDVCSSDLAPAVGLESYSRCFFGLKIGWYQSRGDIETLPGKLFGSPAEKLPLFQLWKISLLKVKLPLLVQLGKRFLEYLGDDLPKILPLPILVKDSGQPFFSVGLGCEMAE